ncbi:MAG: c-type cytochrome biogenesis protein CcmF [Legionellales bacterium RIFCSPHIGHO2_12_FULL_35_11]|nr:MAG: c-type cytochrome biogenesis protein CcmF [Legionellales bacterium RIFCSPHIGHO2_12_FULL_35_11]
MAEIGMMSLIIAMGFSWLLFFIPAFGLLSKKSAWINSTTYLIYGQVLFITMAYCSLTLCFLNDDFSVRYVVTNSSIYLPWFYKLCAVWGGHEGSMLLWVTILSWWTLAVAHFSQKLNQEIRTRVLAVLGLLSIGFIVFLLIASNPFLRQFASLNTPGQDLNPLLQDIGFLLHPPVLYIGYVGFAVAFAFAIAVLWTGSIENQWMQWIKPWITAAWCALTLGITLGSWWAYRELGWGGFWFWDPVENAAFMPWLIGTALIHALVASQKQQQFIIWTLLLAILAFCLSLIGTFLVRSGVITSVHAFAVDPLRGLYILGLLVIIIGGSLLVFTLKANKLINITLEQAKYSVHWLSKINVLVLNTIFLTVIMLTILLGTIYPMLIDGLGFGKLSVGAPYFNTMFNLLMLPILIIMGFGIHMSWTGTLFKQLLHDLGGYFVFSIIFPAIILMMCCNYINLLTWLWLVAATWIILSTIKLIAQRYRKINIWAMSIAHIGVALIIIGISVSNGYGVQKDVKLAPNQHEHLLDYVIKFISTTTIQGPNYHGIRAHFIVHTGDKQRHIYPEKRIYNTSQTAMTEAAIDVNPFRDLYIALGEPLGSDSWSVRIYFKPLVRFIWGGGLLILIGGLISLFNKYNPVTQGNLQCNGR